MKFSERMWIVKVENIIQIDFINSDLTNRLWNFIYDEIIDDIKDLYQDSEDDFLKHFKTEYLKLTIDEYFFVSSLKNVFLKSRRYEKYDLLEAVIKLFEQRFPDAATYKVDMEYKIDLLNKILIEEFSWYRFIWWQFIPLININEIESIQSTLEVPYSWVKVHMSRALELLSDKKNPDYRNSIKESISWVESLIKLIVWKPSITLWKWLQELQKQWIIIDVLLQEAYEKIYGRSSWKNWIRHGLSDSKNIEQEDALYMLISCSAFINYLISKFEKNKIK